MTLPHASPPHRPYEPESVVRYMPNGRFGRMIWPFVFGIPVVASLAFGVEMLIPCRVQCDRAVGLCTVYAPTLFTGVSTGVAISAIRGTQVATSHNKSHQETFMLNLVGPAGAIATSTFYSTDLQYIDAKAAIDAFLADKSQTKLDVITAESSSAGVAVIALSGLWLVIIWLLLQWAQVVVDWRARTLTIVRQRWPLAPKRLTFPLDSVRDAIVTSGSKGSTGVSLMIDNVAREVPLLAMKSSGSRPKEQAVADIRALLKRRDSQR